MDIARFQALLDARGGDPDRWPERERSVALAFAARSPEAARALAAAQELDRLLTSGLAREAGANLAYRITAAAAMDRVPAPRPFRSLFDRWRVGAATAAAAASMALGMVVGLETNAAVLDLAPQESIDLAALAFGEVSGLEDIP